MQYLREACALTGTKVGCDTSSCGACTVLVDGESVKSCTMLAAQADGASVTTIEGLADGDEWHPVQQAFHEHHGLQCGYCTAGMVMAAVSLLEEIPDPTERDVRLGIEGNLCRCTGYHNIVESVLAAAEQMRTQPDDPGRRSTTCGPSRPTTRSRSSPSTATTPSCSPGGMSLLPLMKLRLATPTVLVDVGRVRDLSYVRDAGDHVAIGALTRHRDVETSDVLGRECGVMRAVAAQVGDNQVRHRGTIGGSVAHGDPASDLPAALARARRDVRRAGPGRRRARSPASDFFQGFLETALAPDELLREIRVPKTGANGFAFEKFNRRAQDFATVGVVAARVNGATHVGLINMGSTPLRATGGRAGARAGRVGGRRRRARRRRHRAGRRSQRVGRVPRAPRRVLVRRALEAL